MLVSCAEKAQLRSGLQALIETPGRVPTAFGLAIELSVGHLQDGVVHFWHEGVKLWCVPHCNVWIRVHTRRSRRRRALTANHI